jgi:hypothetical protein
MNDATIGIPENPSPPIVICAELELEALKEIF